MGFGCSGMFAFACSPLRLQKGALGGCDSCCSSASDTIQSGVEMSHRRRAALGRLQVFEPLEKGKFSEDLHQSGPWILDDEPSSEDLGEGGGLCPRPGSLHWVCDYVPSSPPLSSFFSSSSSSSSSLSSPSCSHLRPSVLLRFPQACSAMCAIVEVDER